MACGSGDRLDYKYIYFVAPNIKTLWRTVCVKTCPDSNST